LPAAVVARLTMRELRGRRARDELIAPYLRVVAAVARSSQKRLGGRDYDDVYQAGCVALLEAADRWRGGIGFGRYALVWIRRAVRPGRDAALCGLGLLAGLAQPQAAEAGAPVLSEAMAAAVRQLEPFEQWVLACRYPEDGSRPRTYGFMAGQAGCDSERLPHVERLALEHLRVLLSGAGAE
jgi:RNA polymerase sigma factor (sigma-70 family)